MNNVSGSVTGSLTTVESFGAAGFTTFAVSTGTVVPTLSGVCIAGGTGTSPATILFCGFCGFSLGVDFTPAFGLEFAFGCSPVGFLFPGLTSVLSA